MDGAQLPAGTLEILDSAPALIAGADAGGRVVVFNRACEALTGYTRDEVLGGMFVDVLVPVDWQARVRSRFEGTPAEALALPHRNPWRTKGGEERLIEWRCFPAEVGGVPCVLGIGHDVTELSHAERRLAVQHVVTRILGESRSVDDAAASILAALCEALDFDAGGLWTADDTGQLRCRHFVSRGRAEVTALERLSRSLRLGRGEGLPGQVWDTGKPVWIRDLASHSDFLRPAAARAAAVVSALAFPVVGHDFTGVVELFSGERREPDPQLLDVLEAIAGQIGAFVERVRAEEHARQAQQLAEHESRIKDELFNRISHELRNPLAAIAGWLTILQRGADNEATRARALEVAQRNTALLRLLADDLLDAARIGLGGAVTMTTERLNLTEVLRDVVAEASVPAGIKGVRIALDAPEDEPVVDGDPLRLRQVFGNVLANAVKFTPAGRGVAVTLAPEDGTVAIRVADEGVGMTAEEVARVFDRYWQADSTWRGGLGLGLAIARHIVELHGGSIEAASDGPDRGSLFTIRLPRA